MAIKNRVKRLEATLNLHRRMFAVDQYDDEDSDTAVRLAGLDPGDFRPDDLVILFQKFKPRPPGVADPAKMELITR